MPKLIVIAACEKVIVDKQGPPSLISIFQRMNIQLQDVPLPEGAVAPMRWAVFTLWQYTPEDKNGMEFTQRSEVIGPLGTLFATSDVKFTISNIDDLQSNVFVDILGIPVQVEGLVKIRVWLNEMPTQVGEYFFTIKHHSKVNP